MRADLQSSSRILCANLVKYGHSSEIISTSQYCHGDEDILLKRLNEFAPTTFLRESGRIASLSGSNRQTLSESICAADIVHLHTLWNPINTIVRRACSYYRRPYVLMPHGMLDPYSLAVKRWRKAFYLWAIERRNILAAKRIIYTTPEEMRLATVSLPSLPKGVVVPLGGDAPNETPEDLATTFYNNFPMARGRQQLLFLGRLHFKKGLDRILTVLPAIVQRVPEVLLTVVGDGDPKFEQALRSEIAYRNLANNVLMTGRLHGAAKWGAYATAELFLLPSRQENFAITVAEAMQMGVPVVVSDKVNTWPYVKAADAGIVLDEKRIETDLERAVVSLLCDAKSLRLIGQRGREYARKNLTWAGAARKMMECYTELLTPTNS